MHNLTPDGAGSSRNSSSAVVDASGRNIGESSVKQKAANNLSMMGQSTMDQWATSAKNRPCNKARAEILTKMVVKCVVDDYLPLSFLKDSSLRDLLMFTEPNYQPPTHCTVRAHLMKQTRKEEKV